MKNLSNSVLFLILCAVLTFVSCKSVAVVDTAVPIALPEEKSAIQAYEVIENTVDLAGKSPGGRDIDNREWLMEQINLWADRDQLFVSLVYDALYYNNWDDETKRQFLQMIVGESLAGERTGRLNELRAETLSELDYLLKQSLLLKESPWMVRDFYDEKSEFSYWYLIYMGRSFDREWQKNTVLPVLRDLIREDRITAASYIWLNKPDSLGSMESEIKASGYPWNRILHLLKMGRYIRTEVNRLYPRGKGDLRAESMLF